MASTYDPIATTTLSGSSSLITFSSIPNTYTDLRLSFTYRSDIQPDFIFNNNTTSLYSRVNLRGNGSSATGAAVASDNSLTFDITNSTTYSTFSTVDIFSYAGGGYKTVLITSSNNLGGTGFVTRSAGLFRTGTAISRLDLRCGGSFSAGTTATLYGILKA